MNNKRKEKVLYSKQGMTLAEMLVAMALLALIALTFMPLFSNYYKNIKKAGDTAKDLYTRASRMERIVSGITDTPGKFTYEQYVSNVPITFKAQTGNKTEVSFSGTNQIEVKGSVLTDNYIDPNENTFSTFSAHITGNQLACFPNVISDDFSQKTIYVVVVGREFNNGVSGEDRGEFDTWILSVNVNGTETVLTKGVHYAFNQLIGRDIIQDSSGKYTIARITLFGANDKICFENSPLTIKCNNDTVSVDITAPEIILVGEGTNGTAGTAAGQTNNRYYYGTAGVQFEDGSSEPSLEIIAKPMSGSPLTSAMNDVEGVQPGMGDDGHGNKNKYGYYIMGGDAGQVRRFWQRKDIDSSTTSKNYCWSGDYLNNYNRYIYLNSSGNANSGSFENFNRTFTTQASFKSVFRSDASSGKITSSKTGLDANAIMTSSKIGLFKYEAITTNYFTANCVNGDTYYMTIGNVINAKWRRLASVTHRKADGANSGIDFDGIPEQQWTWFTGDNNNTKLNATGYKEATKYEYPNDNSLITITSVGAIQMNKNNSNFETVQGNSLYTNNVYPTQSYTLYCGYIPSVTDIYGYKTSTIYWKGYVHLATLGAGYSSITHKFYPTGKFGDTYTTSKSLDPAVMGNLAYTSLLCWKNGGNYPSDPSNPSIGKYKVNKWEAGSAENPGLLLPAQGNEYYASGGHEVDISMGYLSEPFAICNRDPEVPSITGLSGSDYYFEKFNDANGKFDHSFFSGGLRDNVTMLDVKSIHDDITGNNISLAVGYTLSYMIADNDYLTRMQQAYNTGIVYIRATGDGSNNDTKGSLDAGKGWSLAKETNVFHQFHGINQYNGNEGGIFSKDGTNALYGWDTTYHRTYLNISSKDSESPKSGFSPNFTPGNTSYGVNCHPLMDTECTAVNWGSTWDGNHEAMWGTANGTLLSWYYDQANPAANSKITSVFKEFESYLWCDRLGYNIKNVSDDLKKQYYDYRSVSKNHHYNYGFISVLQSVNALCYGDEIWVAVGNWSGKNPSDYCASSNCYSASGTGTYINVRYYDSSQSNYRWKAIKVTDDHCDITSVSFCNGWWYISGNELNNDGSVKNGVFFFSRDPLNSQPAESTNNLRWREVTTANVYNSDGSVSTVPLARINSMASQEG